MPTDRSVRKAQLARKALSTAERRSVTFDDSSPVDSQNATRPRSPSRPDGAKPAAQPARASSISSVRSSTSQRSSSVAQRMSGARTSRTSSEQPSQQSRLSSARPEKGTKESSGSGNGKPRADPLTEITNRALSSLQVPVLKSLVASASRAKPKERRSILNKVQATVLRAHQDGVKEMENAFSAESEALFDQFLRESLSVFSREVRLLQVSRREERATAQRRLEYAASATDTLFKGVLSMLDAARGAGANLCEESGLLASSRAGDRLAAADAVTGRAMPEVRDQQTSSCAGPSVKDTHGPQRVSDADREARRAIETFFGAVTEAVRGKGGVAMEKSGVAHRSTAGATLAVVEAATDQQEGRLDTQISTAALSAELHHLTDALSALLGLLHSRDMAQRQQITAQKRVLDEHATRLKLADDVLRDTVDQAHSEASYAVQQLEALDARLRSRMDAVEEGAQLALAALIADKTDVCIDNGVYSDRAALAQYREDTTHRTLTRMEGLRVEQAGILRTVQDALIAASRREAHRGREEKVVHVHTVLPATTRAVLESGCDRATLLRFIHHMTLHSGEAASLLVGAVNEHTQYLSTHPDEATAAKEAARTHAAVTALLTRMHEESLIARNPHDVSPSLCDTLEHMVAQYNAYIDFHVSHAKAALRHEEHYMAADAQRRAALPGQGGFFAESVPLPASMVENDAGGRSRQNPYSTTLYQPRVLDASASPIANPCRKVAPVQHAPAPPPPLSLQKHSLGLSHGSERTVAETVVALQRANPSEWDPKRSATASVVGDSRWTAAAPVHSEGLVQTTHAVPSAAASGVRGGGDALVRTQPVLPHVTGRRPSGVTTAWGAAKAVPAPAVPPRKLLAAHVLAEYGQDVDAALNAVKAHHMARSSPRTALPAVVEKTATVADDDEPGVYVPGSIHTTFAPLLAGEDTTSDTARVFPARRRQLAYQDGDSEYIEKQRQTFSVFSAPNVNYL